MIYKLSQIKAFNDAKAECDRLETTLRYLEGIAGQAPEYAQKVSELRDLLDHANMLAACGLAGCGQ